MNALLTDIFDLGQTALIVAFAVFLRVGGAMALLPAFGERAVPERIRLMLALGFTVIIAPGASPMVEPAVLAAKVPLWLLGEIIAGLAIGIVIRLFIMALQMAGSIAAQATSLSQLFGGAATDPQPAIGHVLLIGGLALAVLLGLHVKIVEVILLSYDVFPPGQMPSAATVSDWGIGRIASAFSLAFSLSAPFVIASLVYNVALGVINRAMPQLMVAFVGAPAITAGGLILLTLTAPLLLETWRSTFFLFLSDPFGAP